MGREKQKKGRKTRYDMRGPSLRKVVQKLYTNSKVVRPNLRRQVKKSARKKKERSKWGMRRGFRLQLKKKQEVKKTQRQRWGGSVGKKRNKWEVGVLRKKSGYALGGLLGKVSFARTRLKKGADTSGILGGVLPGNKTGGHICYSLNVQGQGKQREKKKILQP